MIKTGEATLYFSHGGSDAIGCVMPDHMPEITNWPGTLRFTARGVRRFRHPFAREAWLGQFTGPDDKLWRFKNIGDTQIADCRRVGKG